MPMYKVYLSRPSTPPPQWDFMESIDALTGEVAAAMVWRNWLKSGVTPQPPLLKECRTSVVLLEQSDKESGNGAQEMAGA